MSQHAAIEATGVRKRFGTRDVLCDVDLVAHHGRLHGLLGPNGAGKTTLLRVLLGLVRRDAGAVRLLGSAIESNTEVIPEGVAGCVEAPSFYPYLTGRQNLSAFGRLDGRDRSGVQRRIDDALEHVGLGAQANARVGGYSAGMRQRLALAAALIRSPRLLFLDEPTNSLDPGGARDVRTLAQRLAHEGTAVVLSSHDMAEVESLCDAVTIINHGRVVFSGAVAELKKRAPAAVHLLRTSDDDAALTVASGRRGVKVSSAGEGGLDITADVDALDAYVIALGQAGVAVRALESRVRSLESLFLELTARAAAGEESEAVSQASDEQMSVALS